MGCLYNGADRLISNYTNGDHINSGQGNLDTGTGVFEAGTPGHYIVTYSGHVWMDTGVSMCTLTSTRTAW